MKILIYISSLQSGGAEKVASLMANYWSLMHSVTVLTAPNTKEDFFILNKNIKRKATAPLGNTNNFYTKPFLHIKSIYNLRKEIKEIQPDVIVSHMNIANIRILIASINLKIPIIVEDHNNPQFAKISQPWKMFYPKIYIFAQRIVLLTENLKQHYPKYLHAKISIIPNPLSLPKKIINSSNIKLKDNMLISMGNIRYIKGFDLLLQSCAIVFKKHPNWNLTIIGDGPEKSNLEQLATELNIENNIYFSGRVNQPYGVLLQAEIYILSSRSEGFPVALCEAMGLGIPSISFDCPTGPSDIIVNGENGILVEYLNIEKLSDEIIKLIENPILRDKISQESKKINDTLDINTIMKKWDNIIENIK